MRCSTRGTSAMRSSGSARPGAGRPTKLPSGSAWLLTLCSSTPALPSLHSTVSTVRATPTTYSPSSLTQSRTDACIGSTTSRAHRLGPISSMSTKGTSPHPMVGRCQESAWRRWTPRVAFTSLMTQGNAFNASGISMSLPARPLTASGTTSRPSTPKPLSASSNEGDIVLDPFCGCGTAAVAAQKLGRRWIGIDITHLAITLIKTRLKDSVGLVAGKDYEVKGEPVSVPDAQTLAATDPWQFQWWALGLVGARPTGQKKGADKGIDGRLYFHDEAGAQTKQVILSVKAGHPSAPHVRDLRGVVEREGAAIGVLITMQEPTSQMRAAQVAHV